MPIAKFNRQILVSPILAWRIFSLVTLILYLPMKFVHCGWVVCQKCFLDVAIAAGT